MSPEDRTISNSPQPLSIAFHVGAHKTATSHLQRCLNKASEDLAAQGVRFYGPKYLRLSGQGLPALFGLQDMSPPTGLRTPQEQLAHLSQGGHRLIFSEENYIGALNSVHARGLRVRYKSATHRLADFAAAVGQDSDIFVAVRRPTDFSNSAYCQMLLGGQALQVGTFMRPNPLSGVDWLGLVTRNRAAKGVGRVFVWRYEDYVPLFPKIMAELVGQDHAHLVPMIPRKVNVGLSAAAVAEVLHRTAHDPVERIGMRARNMLPVGAGYPAFDAFSAQEHAASDAVYSGQLAQIGAMEGVTLWRPDAP